MAVNVVSGDQQDLRVLHKFFRNSSDEVRLWPKAQKAKHIEKKRDEDFYKFILQAKKALQTKRRQTQGVLRVGYQSQVIEGFRGLDCRPI